MLLLVDTDVASAEPAVTVMVTMPTVSVLMKIEVEASAGATVTKTVSVAKAEQVASSWLIPKTSVLLNVCQNISREARLGCDGMWLGRKEMGKVKFVSCRVLAKR